MATSNRRRGLPALLGVLLCTALLDGVPAAAQDAGAVWHSELGASGLYLRSPGVETDEGTQGGYGLDYSYSFRPLEHDAAHRTIAAKTVLRKHWLSVAGRIGPQYSDGPDVFATDLAGAGLVTENLGIGWAFDLRDRTSTTTGVNPVDITFRDYRFGLFIEIYASPTVLLREMIGTGAEQRLVDGEETDRLSVLQYEHFLAITDGDGFGYIHELIVRSLSDVHRIVTFDQYFEAAVSTQFSVMPVLRLWTLIPDTGGASWRGGAGLGFQAHFTPRFFAQLTPVYSINPKNEGDDILEISVRAGFRF